MAGDSEFRAYEYIRQTLADLGWDTRNPARRGGGGVKFTPSGNFTATTPF